MSYDDVSAQTGEHRRWYVAMTSPRREFLALRNLERQGFGSFLPLHRVTRRHARKCETVLAPVFPGYIFISFDVGHHQWRRINGTCGIARLVTAGELPVPLAPGVAETLLLSIDKGGVLTYRPRLNVGDGVRLLAGPLADRLGVLERLDGKGRISLLLDFLGSKVRVSVRHDEVMPAQLSASA